MASKDSEELNINDSYSLGEYSFRVERSAGTSPGYDKIEAICTKGGKNARKSIQVPSNTQLEGWYVEANETEATVYAVVLGAGDVPTNVSGGTLLASQPYGADVRNYFYVGSGAYYAGIKADQVNHGPLIIANNANDAATRVTWSTGSSASGAMGTVQYNGRTYYWNSYYWIPPGGGPSVSDIVLSILPSIVEGTDKTYMVGRFAIDLEDAGGDGPGSDWTDPGDYDPDWEEGDPTHTLYVEVTGALSGRHNDPIVDPSYSYIPADKDTVKDYGCGGDGGHGGGGGAGASTVVVHKFATNQANSKEITALARRHGYGSGGGKGGKGGDGCILVYY